MFVLMKWLIDVLNVNVVVCMCVGYCLGSYSEKIVKLLLKKLRNVSDIMKVVSLFGW